MSPQQECSSKQAASEALLNNKQVIEILKGLLLLGFLGYLWYSLDPESLRQSAGEILRYAGAALVIGSLVTLLYALWTRKGA